MNTLNFDDDRQLEAAFSEAAKAFEPPAGVKEVVRQRLFGEAKGVAGAKGDSPIFAETQIGTVPRSRWVRRAWLLAVGAAAVVIVAVVFQFQSSTLAWAQVVQTVRTMPWIHIKAVGGDAKSRGMRETWVSYSREIAAVDGGDLIAYSDYRSGIGYEYDARKKTLYRLAAVGTEHFKAEAAFFEAILRGDAIRSEDMLGPRVVKQRQRTVEEQGRRWIVYELEIANPGDKDLSRTGSMVIRVDPKTKLPDRITFARGEEQMQVTLDYPAEGPADIYALGVPRDARVEDRMPPPELTRILKIIEKNRQDFGDYLAVAGGNNQHRPFDVQLVRCKGGKFRVDVGVGDVRRVASAADMETWWRERGSEILLEGASLFDGRRLYEHTPVKPETLWEPSTYTIRPGENRGVVESYSKSAAYFVELLAYPRDLDPQNLASSSRRTARLDPKGENGPAGSVRVEVLWTNQGAPYDRNLYHRQEYWLQPKYGYAVVKHVASDCPAANDDRNQRTGKLVHEYDGYRQTPHGIWYPTVSRFKSGWWSASKSKPGGVEIHDQVTYFYLDFAAEMPDELFNTAYKGDLLAGIKLARPSEGRTSNDLGEIRPPGGVPLMPYAPGTEISVGPVERMRQRLEAAPAKDLDDWAAELERITGQKLQPWEEWQGCRTHFVDKMGMAFDGLKWKTDVADRLFNRVRTLPPSEVKAWQKAFERAMNQKIDRAYVVPLVLIPVDALFEGEKYSTERAKKYLAHLGQLSEGDVLLWIKKVDAFGGTRLDAAMNIILLDTFFDKEKFQRDKFKAAVEARKK
jgi:hypothetical protein